MNFRKLTYIFLIGILVWAGGYGAAYAEPVSSASSNLLRTGQVLQITLPVPSHGRNGIVLSNSDGTRFFIGTAKQPFVNICQKNKWQKKWQPWRWATQQPKLAKKPSLTFHLLHLENMLFLEIGAAGHLETLFEVGRAPLKINLPIQKNRNKKVNINWTIHPLKISHQSANSGELKNHPTIVNYLGWYPVDYTKRAFAIRDTDFPVYPLGNQNRLAIIRHEIMQMAHFGWSGVAVDSLFFSPNHIQGQYALLKDFIKQTNQAGLKHFYIYPFLETNKTKPYMTAAGVEYMLCRLGNHPTWAHWRGRPVIFAYGAKARGSAFWKQVTSLVRQNGSHPFWVFGLGGLKVALFGTVDQTKIKSYIKLCDGAFAFSASSLLAGAQFPHNLRTAFGKTYPKLVIGASIWPGYLSHRAVNRNFNSPMGSKFLRNVWQTTLEYKTKPDFIHWSTWNDYTESTTLSQSYSVLTSRLEISQRYLDQYHNLPLPQGKRDVAQAVLSYRKCIYQGEPITFEFLPLPTQRGPQYGKWNLQLLDETGKVITQANSPAVKLNQMTPWNWQLTAGVSRSNTRVVRVRVSLTLPDGKKIRYVNLPDIAVAVPTSYADQLYYSIPLSHLAGPNRHVKMFLNGSDQAAVTALGLRAINYEVQGAGSKKAQVASMRNGHALRFLAPLDTRGAEFITDGREQTIHFRSLKAGQPVGWTCWAPTDTDGRDYFAALARFPDGKWAYSPTVWTIPPIDPSKIEALWIFAPSSYKDKSIIKDRSIHHVNLTIPKQSGLKFIKLPGNGRALYFDGKSCIKVPAHLTSPGPITLEVLFRPTGKINRSQVLVYQRGAQASLLINKQGQLVGRRLPEIRKSHNPFVTIQTSKPLTAGQFYDAVLTFDGKTLTMYLSGKLIGTVPCTGTRSTEGFVIGGPMSSSTKVSKTVDGLSSNTFLHGDIVRISLFSGPLKPDQIEAIYNHDKKLPFWKNK